MGQRVGTGVRDQARPNDVDRSAVGKAVLAVHAQRRPMVISTLRCGLLANSSATIAATTAT